MPTNSNDHVDRYARDIARERDTGIAGELTYRPALKTLVEAAFGVHAIHEAARAACGAPDFTIRNGANVVGYIETKAPNADLGAIHKDSERAKPKTRDGEQVRRYRENLSALVLTNFHEALFYRGGVLEFASPRVRVDRIMLHDAGLQLRGFLEALQRLTTAGPEKLKSPSELTVRMACTARFIRDLIQEGFRAQSLTPQLSDLSQAIKATLMPSLTDALFSDMIAQTLTYAVFTARINHRGDVPFRLSTALGDLPRSNPFLRHFYAIVAGPDFEREPFADDLDELAQVLARTDITAMLADFGASTGSRDPILHFYEDFLTQYDPKARELRGVYYTPEPVVAYIVRSVDEVLQRCFKTSLDNKDDDWLILDPACGTGTFIYAILARVRQSYIKRNDAGSWASFVRERLLHRLVGFELLMAPYVVAHLKLTLALSGADLPEAQRSLFCYTLSDEDRLRIYLTNALHPQSDFHDVLFANFLADEAHSANDVKENEPVLVVIGNPPYSGHSANPSEEIVNGKPVKTWIGKLIEDYLTVKEANKKWLHDDYVKFMRFAEDRIERSGHGIMAFVTNHSYIDNPTFAAMRRRLTTTFDEIYVLDLHGNVKSREVSPDGTPDKNVFDIQQGVAISIFVKHKDNAGAGDCTVKFAELFGDREPKYEWLSENGVESTAWQLVDHRSASHSFRPGRQGLPLGYEAALELGAVLPTSSLGILTKRDGLAIGFSASELTEKLRRFADQRRGDDEIAAEFRLPLKDKDRWDLHAARQTLTTIAETAVRPVQYRCGDFRYYYDHPSIVARLNYRVLNELRGEDNFGILVGRQGGAATSGRWDSVWISADVPDQNLFRRGGATVFPTRVGGGGGLFAEGSWNISEAFRAEVHAKTGVNRQESELISYIYGLLNSTVFRDLFAEELKKGFPRVPVAPSAAFAEISQLGAELIELHLFRRVPDVVTFPIPGDNVITRDAFTLTSSQSARAAIVLNDVGQHFSGVTDHAWTRTCGGYRVLEAYLKARRGRALTLREIQGFQLLASAFVAEEPVIAGLDAVLESGW